MFNRKNDFCDEIFRLFWRKVLMFLDQWEKVASRAQIENQIQVIFRLEGGMQLDDERVRISIEATEYIPFTNDLLDSIHVSVGELLVVHVAHGVLFFHHYLPFMDNLHRIKATCDLASGEHDLSKGSFTEDFDQFVILNALPLFQVLLLDLFQIFSRCETSLQFEWRWRWST